MTHPLFTPLQLGSLRLASRMVMAPMTRRFSPGGVPTEEVAEYYAKRARHGVGLIVTEPAWVDAPAASHVDRAPDFFGAEALAGWQRVVDRVHAEGGKIFVQLWHVGIMRTMTLPPDDTTTLVLSPSGIAADGTPRGRAMTEADIQQVINAFADAVATAQDLGFDGVELHAAHGYLLDQFFSAETNRRTDQYGGSPRNRGRFCGDLVAECRRRVGPDFPIAMRISQWKLWDYSATIADSPEALREILMPSVEAGVSLLHCSTRRFWEPAFEGSDLGLAGWVKELTGVPTVTCGSVGLNADFMAGFEQNHRVAGEVTEQTDLSALLTKFGRGEFDLVAVGRQLLSDPEWAAKVRDDRRDDMRNYNPEALQTLT